MTRSSSPGRRRDPAARPLAHRFASDAVGLIVAEAVLDGMSLDATGFVVAVAIFTIVFALLQPFLVSVLRGSRAPVLGGVALIATLVSLIAAFVLPYLGLRKYLDDRRR